MQHTMHRSFRLYKHGGMRESPVLEGKGRKEGRETVHLMVGGKV